MGINDFIKHLPGGDKYIHGLDNASIGSKAVNLDSGSLLWQCANISKIPYLRGDYAPAVKSFQAHVSFYYFVRNIDLFVCFDGPDPPEKSHERDRRGDNLRNTSTYIALCVKVCRNLQIPHAVGAQEADFQAVMARREKKNPIVMTNDSDIVAYGGKNVIFMKLWTIA